MLQILAAQKKEEEATVPVPMRSPALAALRFRTQVGAPRVAQGVAVAPRLESPVLLLFVVRTNRRRLRASPSRVGRAKKELSSRASQRKTADVLLQFPRSRSSVVRIRSFSLRLCDTRWGIGWPGG